jgi:hypothetical protein
VPRTEPEQRIPGHRDEPEISPPVRRGASAEEAPELLGERSDQPVLYGEDPGDIGP